MLMTVWSVAATSKFNENEKKNNNKMLNFVLVLIQNWSKFVAMSDSPIDRLNNIFNLQTFV